MNGICTPFKLRTSQFCRMYLLFILYLHKSNVISLVSNGFFPVSPPPRKIIVRAIRAIRAIMVRVRARISIRVNPNPNPNPNPSPNPNSPNSPNSPNHNFS